MVNVVPLVNICLVNCSAPACFHDLGEVVKAMDGQVQDVDARAGMMMCRKDHKEKNGDDYLVITRRILLTYNDGG